MLAPQPNATMRYYAKMTTLYDQDFLKHQYKRQKRYLMPKVPKCLAGAQKIELGPNVKIFEAGDSCDHFYYLIKGSVRVELLTYSGKPITLYRFGSGESCILTSSCLLSGDPYNAEAITETMVEALAVPIIDFRYLLENSDEFRQLVFQSFGQRLSEMMMKIEQIISVPIHQRLAILLLNRLRKQNPIIVTHDQIASEIGTAREVITRKLHSWDEEGLIIRGRGKITIIDEIALRKITNSTV